MSWLPISRDELTSDMAVALDAADDEVRAAWERLAIEPEKWRCSPWGDEGGGFWVVGIDGEIAIWFNDIEGGFNRSRFEQRGTLRDYGSGQGDFYEFLSTLPEAERAAEYAAAAPAHEIPVELRGAGTIERRKTSYWDLETSRGTAFRVHFSGKYEHHFVGPEYQTLQLFESHPVLLDYQEPWSALYVSNAQSAGQAMFDELSAHVEAATHGWRQLRHYLAASGPTSDVLRGGLLLRAPHSTAEQARKIVQKHGGTASLLPDRKARLDACALVLGQGFIVARVFRLSRYPNGERNAMRRG
jgi:hypothetical protein